MTETASYIASRGACWRDRRGRSRCRDRRARSQRAFAGCDDDRLQRRQRALAVGLPQRNEPGAGGNPVRGQRVQKRVHRRCQRDPCAADDADRDGIDDRAVAGRDQAIEPVAIPRRPRDLDKGAALRRGFQMALARGREGAASSATSRNLHRRKTPPRGARAPEIHRRRIRDHRRASMQANPAAWPCRRYRRLPPPIRCRWNRRMRRPETPATARSSAGTAQRPHWRRPMASAPGARHSRAVTA